MIVRFFTYREQLFRILFRSSLSSFLCSKKIFNFYQLLDTVFAVCLSVFMFTGFKVQSLSDALPPLITCFMIICWNMSMKYLHIHNPSSILTFRRRYYGVPPISPPSYISSGSVFFKSPLLTSANRTFQDPLPTFIWLIHGGMSTPLFCS